MDDSLPRAWTDPADAALELFGVPEDASAGALKGPHQPRDFAKKLFAYEALQPAAPDAPAPVPRPHPEPEPFSLQWFLDVQRQRHSRHARWIPKLMEFAKHSGERLLGLGHGLGTDWVQYAAHGAQVIVCSSSPAQLDLVHRNFALRGLTGAFIHAAPTLLPLEPASVDVACISSLHHGIDHLEGMIEEVHRVLKPGGKVLAVTPAHYDVEFWRQACFFWYRWLVPAKASTPAPQPHERCSGRGLRRLFGRFVEHRIHKRQLRRSEVPHLWRWLPLPLLARLMGRVLVMKAFKPVK